MECFFLHYRCVEPKTISSNLAYQPVFMSRNSCLKHLWLQISYHRASIVKTGEESNPRGAIPGSAKSIRVRQQNVIMKETEYRT